MSRSAVIVDAVRSPMGKASRPRTDGPAVRSAACIPSNCSARCSGN